jgi:hypothetical protein
MIESSSALILYVESFIAVLTVREADEEVLSAEYFRLINF